MAAAQDRREGEIDGPVLPDNNLLGSIAKISERRDYALEPSVNCVSIRHMNSLAHLIAL
jgi:hypothetical protein